MKQNRSLVTALVVEGLKFALNAWKAIKRIALSTWHNLRDWLDQFDSPEEGWFGELLLRYWACLCIATLLILIGWFPQQERGVLSALFIVPMRPQTSARIRMAIRQTVRQLKKWAKTDAKSALKSTADKAVTVVLATVMPMLIHRFIE